MAKVKSDSDTLEAWNLWKRQYGKSYSTVEDAEKKRVWEATLAKVIAHNLEYDQGLVSYQLEMNKFAVEGPPSNPYLDEDAEDPIEEKKIKKQKTALVTSGRARSPKRQGYSPKKLPGPPTPKKSRLQSPEKDSSPRRSPRLIASAQTAMPTPVPSY